MKKTLKLFIGACLATCALGAQAQSLVLNGGFEAGNSGAATTEYPGQIVPANAIGWDVLTGDGPVFAKQSGVGPMGSGDPSLVVYDDGQQGGISQTIASDAPYLRVTADVFVQYGSAYLSTTSPAGDLNVLDQANQPGQWVTLTGIVPNIGAQYGQPSYVQIRSSDPEGSAFAVDNVSVEPVYDQNEDNSYNDDYTNQGWQNSSWSNGFTPYADPGQMDAWYQPPSNEPITFSQMQAPNYGTLDVWSNPAPIADDPPQTLDDYIRISSELNNLTSLYNMATTFGYGP